MIGALREEAGQGRGVVSGRHDGALAGIPSGLAFVAGISSGDGAMPGWASGCRASDLA